MKRHYKTNDGGDANTVSISGGQSSASTSAMRMRTQPSYKRTGSKPRLKSGGPPSALHATRPRKPETRGGSDGTCSRNKKAWLVDRKVDRVELDSRLSPATVDAIGPG